MQDPAHENLTPSASRSLQHAGQLARQYSHGQAGAVHLLWALLFEEAEAAAILNEFGVGRERLEHSIPLVKHAGGVPEDGTDISQELAAISLVGSGDVCRDLVAVAQSFRPFTVGDPELRTEHLLCAVASVPSEASQFLQEYGITAEILRQRLTERDPDDHTPIQVDFRIQYGHAVQHDSPVVHPVTAEKPPGRGLTTEGRADMLRIIDAAANRAREGLRVLEDYGRFALSDALLSRQLKDCRHGFAQVLRQLDQQQLLRSRDTPADVGTRISNTSEMQRLDSVSVVTANMKRVQEAARTLEECGKLISPSLATGFESLRYELYTIEKMLLSTMHNQRTLAGHVLQVLLTEHICRGDWEAVARAALDGGVSIIQLREKSLSDRDLLDRARRLTELARSSDALLIVNDRADVAAASDAHGVHVGQDDLSVHDARQIVGPDRLIGVSTHDMDQARKAVRDGADYIGVGPVFPSSTKSFDAFSGPNFVKAVSDEITLPWFAIGGINTQTMRSAIAAGVRRAAVSGAVCAADYPARAARELITALRGAGE